MSHVCRAHRKCFVPSQKHFLFGYFFQVIASKETEMIYESFLTSNDYFLIELFNN